MAKRREEADERSEDESESDESENDERDERASDADDEDGDASEDADDDDQGDEAAARVAKSLGVDDDDDKDADGEKPIPQNRALRRREEATERRRKRKAGAADADLPKDKNKRAKELLKQRRKEAEKEVGGLTAGEMVEDSLARGTAAANRWFKENFKLIGYAIIASAVIAAGAVYYFSQEEAEAGVASGDLFEGVSADIGQVSEEDKRSDEEKKYDPNKYFASDTERADAALASFNKVVDAYPGTGPGILAKLGQAGAYFDKGEYKPALDAYNEVAATKLAEADNSVKARAVEGAGYCLEETGDLDGALAKFKELDGLGTGMTELSKYQQARILIAKGDKEAAKTLLVETNKKLQVPELDGVRLQYLKAVVGETLRELDPTAAPAKPSLSGPKGGSLTPEELQKLMEEAQRRAEKREEGEGDEH